MKILQIAEGIFPNSLDGMARHVYELSTNLSNNGHDVDVLVSEWDGSKKGSTYEDDPLQDCITVHQSLPSSIELIREQEYDIVHLHGVGFRPLGIISNDVLILVAKALGAKVVITPHGGVDVLNSPPDVEAQRYPVWAMKFYLQYLIRGPFRLMDAMVALTPFQENEMTGELNLQEDKIKLIPNGISESSFSSANPGKFYKEYGIEEELIILYLGRVAPRKRVHEIVEVLPKLRDNNISVSLAVVGVDDGGLDGVRREIESQNVSEHVEICGRVSESMKYSALAAADVFVNPSEFEGLPTAPLEAMAQGCPVVCADNEGSKHLLGHGEYGLLYPIGETEELLGKLSNLLSNERVRTEYAKLGRDRADEFRWSSVATDIESLYQKTSR